MDLFQVFVFRCECGVGLRYIIKPVMTVCLLSGFFDCPKCAEHHWKQLEPYPMCPGEPARGGELARLHHIHWVSDVEIDPVGSHPFITMRYIYRLAVIGYFYVTRTYQIFLAARSVQSTTGSNLNLVLGVPKNQHEMVSWSGYITSIQQHEDQFKLPGYITIALR